MPTKCENHNENSKKNIEELKAWKEKIDDVVSPSQLKEALEEIENLKIFKTKAITAFAVVQFFMATMMAVLNMY